MARASVILRTPKRFYRSLGPLIRPSDVASAPNGWASIFGRDAPLELEIGFGNGENLQRASAASPERDFVGVELAWNSLKRALRRLSDPPRNNARLLWLPAEAALALLFPPESLSAAHCLFPVPWPNERQASKRLASKSFLDLLANRLRPEGIFRMVTDHEGLASWTMAQAEKSAMRLDLATSPAAIDTKYERKWSLGGQNVFYHLSGVKKTHPQASPPDLNQMPPRYSALINPRDYRPRGRSGSPAIVFGRFVYDEPQGEGLLQAKVAEDHLLQEFHIRISDQGDGRFKLSPALPGQILPTYGVGLALDLAALDPAALDLDALSIASQGEDDDLLAGEAPAASEGADR